MFVNGVMEYEFLILIIIIINRIYKRLPIF